MEAVDTDGNMELDIYEFLMWLEGAQAEGADPFSMLKAKIKAQGLKPLNNSQIEGLRECFNHFDADGSGAIDVHELGNVFHAFGQELSKEELENMIRDVDVDDSGEIEFEEFLMLMIHNFGSDESMHRPPHFLPPPPTTTHTYTNANTRCTRGRGGERKQPRPKKKKKKEYQFKKTHINKKNANTKMKMYTTICHFHNQTSKQQARSRRCRTSSKSTTPRTPAC